MLDNDQRPENTLIIDSNLRFSH